MSLEDLQEVVNDYEKLLEIDEEYNVIIYVGENEDVKELHAHSNILRIRSQYFRTALSNERVKKKDGKYILEKPNISSHIFKIILRFIYCGKIDLTKLEGPELLKLSIAVDELNIQSLIHRIEEYLINHQHEFLQQNPVGILETIYQNESFATLWNFCLEKICEKPEVLFDSDKFISLKAPIVELLLKRDDLNMEEIVIWNSLTQWALAQNSNIPKDVTKWSKEEITIMERTLHRYIPLIRFNYISAEDFHDKVYPLKEILPKDLINGLLTFYLVPNRESKFGKQPPRRSNSSKYDSVIVGNQHFALFASWIDKKDDLYYNSKNIPYNFNLLHRASKEGFDVASFHNNCDDKGATIVVAKIKGTDQIFGGYNPIVWDKSSSYKATYDSFMFSFTNKQDISTAIIGRVKNERYSEAIYCVSSHGPTFGGGHDLHYNCDQSWYNNPNSYPSINLPNNGNCYGNGFGKYLVDDFEVFQVIRK